jgi:serine O-acetyltransferase
VKPIACSLDLPALADYTTRQLEHFFPDGSTKTPKILHGSLQTVLKRLAVCFDPVFDARYHTPEGAPWFHHRHSDQYATYLYMLAHQTWKDGLDREWSEKLYLLNKALHAVDIFYEVELPEIFFLGHPVGTVLGRAHYHNHLVVLQNCTVGGNGDRSRPAFPVLGNRTILCAGSCILGSSHIGDNCCVGAGTLIVNETIPGGQTITGTPKTRIVRPSKFPRWTTYFRS